MDDGIVGRLKLGLLTDAGCDCSWKFLHGGGPGGAFKREKLGRACSVHKEHPATTQMDDKQDVAGLVERLRAMVSRDGRALVCNGRTTKVMCDDITEAATALEAQAAEIARLREAFQGAIIAEVVDRGNWSLSLLYGKGDEACLRARDTSDLIRALTGSQSHDAVAERLKAGTDAAARQVLAAEVDLLMNGDPAAKPKPWGSQSHD